MDMEIVRLTGPDRVRLRPAVVFGAADLDGVKSAVDILLEIFTNEAMLGNCTQLQVRQNGAELEISGNDRGIYVGQDTQNDQIWKEIFCELYARSPFAVEEGGYTFSLIDYEHSGLYGDEDCGAGIMLCAVQYVTEYFHVTVNRGGLRSKLYFEKGYNIGGLSTEKTEEASGTTFRFMLDQEVFSQVELPEEYFLETLERLAILYAGLKCTYCNLQTGHEHSFCYPGGMEEYVSAFSALPVYNRKLEAKGRDRYNRAEYKARVEVAVGYVPFEGEARYYHNYRLMPYGGTPLDRLEKEICDAFNCCFRPRRRFTFEELSRHLQIVLASWCPENCTCWHNGARTGLTNVMIADMTEDLFKQTFGNYLYQNKEQLAPMVEAILQERKK